MCGWSEGGGGGGGGKWSDGWDKLKRSEWTGNRAVKWLVRHGCVSEMRRTASVSGTISLG